MNDRSRVRIPSLYIWRSIYSNFTDILKQTIFDRNSSYVCVDVIIIAIFSHCAHYNIYLSEEKLL